MTALTPATPTADACYHIPKQSFEIGVRDCCPSMPVSSTTGLRVRRSRHGASSRRAAAGWTREYEVIVTNGATIGELLGRPTDLADVNGQAMTPQ